MKKNAADLLYFGIWLVIVSLLLPSARSARAQEPPTVKVSLVLTSGMQNPGWIVSDPADLARLREFLKGLPTAQPVDEPQFGGFLLTGDEAKCRFPARVRVFDGIIKATTADGTTRFFQDKKGLEAFLVQETKTRGL